MSFWTMAEFKDGEVYAECGADGRLSVRAGKVKIAYQREARKTYSTFGDRLKVIDPSQVEEWGAAPAAGRGARGDSSVSGGSASDLTEPAHVHLWTDGACTGNPGPAGAGSVLLDGDQRTEWSTWLGQGTNNIAELSAVLQGIEALPDGFDRKLVIHTDSEYVIGVLSKNWKAKANTELIMTIRAQLQRLRGGIVWHWVRGHQGVELNERCDELARQAIVRRGSTVG